jgi:hypothetical protein
MIRNNYILKTLSLFLSFWMFTASAGISVDFHYCEGEIVDWTILGQELECDHEKEDIKETDSCCKANNHEVICNDTEFTQVDSNCCDSSEAQVIIENEFNISSEEIELIFPALYFLSFFIQSDESALDTKHIIEYQKKVSIPINRKLAVLQTFLI